MVNLIRRMFRRANLRVDLEPTPELPKLPSQTDFLETGVVVYATPLKGSSEQCSICLERCITHPATPIVQVTACEHIFHEDCILRWFTGTNQKRNTCPNCRKELFIANPLTRQQILSMFDTDAEPQEPGAQALNNFPLHPRFGLRVGSDLAHGSDQLNRYLEMDLLSLRLFVRFAIVMEEEFYENMGIGYRWHTTVLDDVLSNYEEEGYPRTNYVTEPTLLRLSAAAALVHSLGQNELYNNTIEFAQLVAHADGLLLQAQREANTLDNPMEYVRILGHYDDWESNRDRFSTGDDERVRWIVDLRIRARGRGADVFIVNTNAVEQQ